MIAFHLYLQDWISLRRERVYELVNFPFIYLYAYHTRNWTVGRGGRGKGTMLQLDFIIIRIQYWKWTVGWCPVQGTVELVTRCTGGGSWYQLGASCHLSHSLSPSLSLCLLSALCPLLLADIKVNRSEESCNWGWNWRRSRSCSRCAVLCVRCVCVWCVCVVCVV